MNIRGSTISKLLAGFLVVGIGFPSIAADSGAITEASAQALLSASDTASMRGDVSELGSYLADSFTAVQSAKGGRGTKMSRKELLSRMEQAFQQYINYRISHDSVKVAVSPDGQSATMSAATVETWTSGKKDTRLASEIEYRIEPRDGKLQFVSATVNVLDTKESANTTLPKDCTYASETAKITEFDPKMVRALITLLGVRPEPFCRSYAADAKSVSGVVQAVVPRLGNPIKVSDVTNGFFTTDFLNHDQVSFAAGAALYQDSYSITVQEEQPGTTIVRVLRTVNAKATDLKYHPWKSTGENERWVLAQISDRLKSKGDQTVTSSPVTGSVAAPSIEDQLKRLKDLRDKNVITEDEYKTMRAKALDAMASQAVK